MRRSALVTSVAVAAVLAGACGSAATKTTNVTPAAAVGDAPAKTLAEKSAKIAVNVRSDSGLLAKGFTQTGAFEFANRRGRFTIDTTPFGMAAGEVQAVFDYANGVVLYLQIPQLAGQLGGKPWVKVDGQALAAKRGFDLNALLQEHSADATSTIDQLRGAVDVTEVGPAKVGGVDTTHYTFSIDLDKAVQAAPADDRAAMQKVRDLTTAKTIPGELWVDAEGRVRRQVTTIDTAALKLPAGTSSTIPPIGKLTVTIDLSDFGVAVDATPPPADEVVDVQTLLDKLESSFGGSEGMHATTTTSTAA